MLAQAKKDNAKNASDVKNRLAKSNGPRGKATKGKSPKQAGGSATSKTSPGQKAKGKQKAQAPPQMWANPRKGNVPSLIKSAVLRTKKRKIHCVDLLQKNVMVEVSSPENSDEGDDANGILNVEHTRPVSKRYARGRVKHTAATAMFRTNDAINTGLLYVCSCGMTFAKSISRLNHLPNCEDQKKRIRMLKQAARTKGAAHAKAKGAKIAFHEAQRGMFERVLIDGVTIDYAATPFVGRQFRSNPTLT